MMLYILEMLYMQIPCVAGGCVLGAAVYHFYAVGNSEVIVWMKPGILVAAIVIHMCILFLTVAIVGRQCVRQSAVTEQRGGYVRKEKRPVSIIVQLIIVAAAVFVIQGVCRKMETLFSATDALVYTQGAETGIYGGGCFGFCTCYETGICDSGCDRKESGSIPFCDQPEADEKLLGKIFSDDVPDYFQRRFFQRIIRPVWNDPYQCR